MLIWQQLHRERDHGLLPTIQTNWSKSAFCRLSADGVTHETRSWEEIFLARRILATRTVPPSGEKRLIDDCSSLDTVRPNKAIW
jgi:hypothetical protein